MTVNITRLSKIHGMAMLGTSGTDWREATEEMAQGETEKKLGTNETRRERRAGIAIMAGTMRGAIGPDREIEKKGEENVSEVSPGTRTSDGVGTKA